MAWTWSRGGAEKTLSPGEDRRGRTGKKTLGKKDGIKLGMEVTADGDFREKGEQLREVEKAISGQISTSEREIDGEAYGWRRVRGEFDVSVCIYIVNMGLIWCVGHLGVGKSTGSVLIEKFNKISAMESNPTQVR
ncbi:hypothetical protein SAY86_012846 [Trapa natans]|uniref:Uncharacterized protein n=1 Tax=Trapa natans TaxID=22666 RepID=A0AAN7R9K4_TRANT|nr:hypothetical protein SAY86_012846 [Trapa natans]